jgi:putative ABC transport system ATP-binding protein
LDFAIIPTQQKAARMEKSIFSFIWKYSKREQLLLLAFTVVTFPFLYATLELPKRIINDAIGAERDMVDLVGVQLTQVQFLFVLCFAYLAAVLVHGLMKMRLNTMKGILSERLLRRFRYGLISRMMRFPRSYYEETSQGELVAMVTSEAEPMGGLMGDAVAQPAFQAGQMLIILIFLFVQSVWFGLAGIALIPLQAWLIPLLQRQINQLNKERIKETRQLASEIGETAAGITDLRTNGGWRYRLAVFTDRLGRLFDIRFQIYQKKFFMKFLNNFITQLTPFFFYLVGGYLAINGQITVGALVAALAAYKDLSSPWRELLLYYNQTQDMDVRWQVVVERFAPRNMIDESLFDGEPQEIPHLRGDIVFDNVSVRSESGTMLLKDLSLTIPKGSRVAIKTSTQTERTAIAELLTRELLPSRGKITLAGHDLSTLHHSVIAARIGYAHANPYLFQGTIGDNLLMSLRTSPKSVLWDPQAKNVPRIESARSGNSPDSTDVDWIDPGLAGLEDDADIDAWWFKLTQAMGIDDLMLRRMLGTRMNPEKHPELVTNIVALRDEVDEKLKEQGLDKVVHRFHPDKFNPAVPLGGNLMFAAPLRNISQAGLAAEKAFLAMIVEQGLAEQGIAISQTLIETLHQTFGMDGTNHPLFTALGIEDELYERLVDIAARRRQDGDGAISDEEFALLLTVPFAFTAEQIGPAFPETFKEEILRIRKADGPSLRERAVDLFVPIAPDAYLPRLTILENLLYGRISMMAGLQADLVLDVVAEVVKARGVQQMVAVSLFDIPTTIGGTNLPASFQERVAFSRAGIKRPDIMVLNQSLAANDASTIAEVRDRLSSLLPETTQIYIDDKFADPEGFDMFIEVSGGSIDDVAKGEGAEDDDSVSGDLRRKLRVISRNELFSKLDARSQRLLAFAAQWYSVDAGQRIFKTGQRADAAYLCLSGKSELSWLDDNGGAHHVSSVEPGRLIGDLAIILDEPRQLEMRAIEDSSFLRIGADQFRSVVENDKVVLLNLLQTVAGHLTGAADLLRAAKISIPREAGPPPPPIDAPTGNEAAERDETDAEDGGSKTGGSPKEDA